MAAKLESFTDTSVLRVVVIKWVPPMLRSMTSSVKRASILSLFSFHRFWSAFSSSYWCLRSLANFYFSVVTESLSCLSDCLSALNRYWNPIKNSSTRAGKGTFSLWEKNYSRDYWCSRVMLLFRSCRNWLIIVPDGKVLVVD